MDFLKKIITSLHGPQGRKVGPIGFDLAVDRLHLMQLERKDSGLCIRAVASMPYPRSRDELLESPAEFRSFVRDALRSGPFKGKSIVSCLSSSKTKIINYSFRKDPDVSDAEVLFKAVVNRLGGAPDDYVIDFLPIRVENPDSLDRKALIAASLRSDVLGYLELLSGAGLEIEALDIGPAALRRLAAAVDKENRYPTVLLLNFGKNSSYLTVLSGKRLLVDKELTLGENQIINQINKALMMDREVQFGEEKLITRLSRAFSIADNQAARLLYDFGFQKNRSHPPGGSAADGEEIEIVETIIEIVKPLFLELAEEVNRVLIYTASETRGGIIERIYLLGSVARYPGADSFMSEIFSIPAEVLNPLANFAASSNVDVETGPVAGIALAAGMSLRGIWP